MTKIYPLGVFRDQTKEADAPPQPADRPPLDEIRLNSGASTTALPTASSQRYRRTSYRHRLRIKIAGFGGQGVLMLGEVMAEAGLEAGLNVSWLPSYGPEMRSGTSNCHVRLSLEADRFAGGVAAQRSAGAQRAVAAQIPGRVEPGGWVLYNGPELPGGRASRGCAR